MLMGCEECRVDRKLSDETASISLVDLRRARTDFAYVEVESRFGLTRVYSLGRWVLASLFGLSVMTGLVLSMFIR